MDDFLKYDRGDKLLMRCDNHFETVTYLNYCERDLDYFICETRDGRISDEWRFDEIDRVECRAKDRKEYLISREKARERIKEICEKYAIPYNAGYAKYGSAGYAFGHAFDDFVDETPEQKSKKEQKVIKCGLCKHYHKQEYDGERYMDFSWCDLACLGEGANPKPYDFCSRAKKE